MTTFRRATLWSDFGTLVFSTMEPSGAVENVLTSLPGWTGGVSVGNAGPARALGHGSFNQRRYRGSRALTLNGTIIFAEQSDRALVERLVSGTAWEGEMWTLQVEEEDSPTLQVQVQLDGEPGMDYLGTNVLKVQIPLHQPDPFLYSAPQEITLLTPGTGVGLDWHGNTGVFTSEGMTWGGESAPAVAHNTGNADAWPVYVIKGVFPSGFTVTLNSRALVYADTVHRGNPVTINTGSGQVLVNGIDVTQRLTRAEWEPIRAKSTSQPTLKPLDNASEGWAEFTWHNTYI